MTYNIFKFFSSYQHHSYPNNLGQLTEFQWFFLQELHKNGIYFMLDIKHQPLLCYERPMFRGDQFLTS